MFAITFDVRDEAAGDIREQEHQILYAQYPPSFIGYRFKIKSGRDSSQHMQIDDFMNDIVLLPLSNKDAAVANRVLRNLETPQTPIVHLNSWSELQPYIQPPADHPIDIRVKGLDGRLVTNRFSPRNLKRQEKPLHLLFILNDGYVCI